MNSPIALRVLCLHDKHSHANELQDQLRALGNRLYENHQIDLIYVNAPLTVAPSSISNTEDNNNNNHPDLPARVWWKEEMERVMDQTAQLSLSEKESSNCTESAHATTSNTSDNITTTAVMDHDPTSTLPYFGLDVSLLLLQQVWASIPIQGILGIGQGATMASLLALLPNLNPTPPTFVVFLQSHASLLESTEPLTSPDTLACLHVVHDKENHHPIHDPCSLLTQFPGPVVSADSSVAAWNAIGHFLVQQKQQLTQIVSSSSSLATTHVLRAEIARVEEQAHQLLIQRLAEQPPASCLAVLTPWAVAGWESSSMRRRTLPGEGAPCPATFLLRPAARVEAVASDASTGTAEASQSQGTAG
jgi:hypothetical protein